MLYICDRSTPDLNKEDEQNNCHQNKAQQNYIHIQWDVHFI